MMKRSYWLVFAALALLLSACGPAELTIKDAWARPALGGGTGAIYLTVHNGTGVAVALTGATTDVARVVEIHSSMIMGEGGEHEHGEGHPTESPMESDVAMMMPVERIDIAPGSSVQLAPGGYHIMLIDLQRNLVGGEAFTVTLHFEGHADIEVEVSVRAQ
jgi:copper(I)-binding protein